jgi:hypothetical protein
MASLNSSNLVLKGDMAIANYTNLPSYMYDSNKIGGKRRHRNKRTQNKRKISNKPKRTIYQRRTRRRIR